MTSILTTNIFQLLNNGHEIHHELELGIISYFFIYFFGETNIII